MEPFQAVTRYMQDSPTFRQDIWFIVVAAAAIGLLWTGITLWDRTWGKNGPGKPRYDTLFIELCQAHKLGAGESQWLQNAAGRFGFDDPARIFFTPQALEAEGRTEDENAGILFTKLYGGDTSAEEF